MSAQYPTGKEGWQYLTKVAAQIKKDRRADYDCIAGISGGCDSSYTLWTAVKLGLKPLCIHFDNGWNTDIAEHNIRVMTQGLDVPLIRHRVDQAEFDSINLAFLRSGVPDFEAPTDIALATVAYRAAEQHNVKWILNGHSFRTEGVTPLGWSYMDGAYIADVCRRFDGPTRFETYPNLWLKDFVRWSWQGYKRLRPLYYVDYNWSVAKRQLADEFGWKWYGQKHGESDLTTFFGSYLLPMRYGIKLITVRYAALVREGQMDREEALAELKKPPALDDRIMERVQAVFRDRSIDPQWWLDVPKRSVDEFKTYRKAFKRLRLLFWAMYKTGRVPKSFYVKYCK